MRVAFLFNHYDVHQIPHTAPFAFALSQREGVEVDIVASCAAQLDFARRLGGVHPGGHSARFRLIGAPLWANTLDKLVSRWVFVRKEAVLRANAELLGGYDAVVSPERTAMRLASRYGQTDTVFIRSMHGAGDRCIGAPGGDADLTSLLLVPGTKHVERYRDRTRARIAPVGSAKFDAVRALSPTAPRLFDNRRPTVLYNPHFCARVSSWQTLGHDVLEWFRDQDDFNLIFAPHVVMFRRARRHKARLPRWTAKDLPDHIHIDTGSFASCDMSYIRAADIYLGDASSQVYEFLDPPRPCVFLDAHSTDWQGSDHHRHWRFGQLARSIDVMGEALRDAVATHPLFLPTQRAAMAHTYARGDTPVAERGADAIETFMRERSARSRIISGPQLQAAPPMPPTKIARAG